MGTHPDDSRVMMAHSGRCFARALQNTELKEALSDCEEALRYVDKSDANYGGLYADRGLVRLRQGNYEKALEDFSDALKRMPKNVLALYGRGVAETRRNLKSQGDMDIEQAKKVDAEWVSRVEKAGFLP